MKDKGFLIVYIMIAAITWLIVFIAVPAEFIYKIIIANLAVVLANLSIAAFNLAGITAKIENKIRKHKE